MHPIDRSNHPKDSALAGRPVGTSSSVNPRFRGQALSNEACNPHFRGQERQLQGRKGEGKEYCRSNVAPKPQPWPVGLSQMTKYRADQITRKCNKVRQEYDSFGTTQAPLSIQVIDSNTRSLSRGWSAGRPVGPSSRVNPRFRGQAQSNKACNPHFHGQARQL